ncbi:kelch-like protein 28 [Amphiura filiformis]|uniref:kelch-like protein 28 n=1 Tax=Amphiura filiformis TaxID=82378 RepID=UPI003B2289F3
MQRANRLRLSSDESSSESSSDDYRAPIPQNRSPWCPAYRIVSLASHGNSSVWEGTTVPSWMPFTVSEQPDHKALLQQLFKVAQGMHELQKNETLCDVVIKVEDTTFHAHKVVLAATSKYFEAMLTSGFQECEQSDSEATISGEADTFKILLDFAYSGKIDVAMETVFSIMDMAHYLQFDYVMDRCVCFLEKALTNKLDSLGIDIALKVLTRADLYGLTSLKKQCEDYLAKNFKVSDAFLTHMTAELMEEMLARSDLTDEKEVFDTTVAWLKHNWESRKTFAPSLLGKIRLGIVPLGHLSRVVVASPKLYEIPECKELIEKAWKLFDAKKPEDPPLHIKEPSLFATRTTVNQLNDPPLHTKEPSLFATRATVNSVLCIGGCSQFYDVKKQDWLRLSPNKFPDLPPKDCTETVDSCCNAEGNLFVVRGTAQLPRRLKCPVFLKFDFISNKWQTLAPLTRRRDKPVLVYMKGMIYAIGGDAWDPCEVYSISTNKWKAIPSIPMNMYDADEDLIPSSFVSYNGVILSYILSEDNEEFDTETEYNLGMYDPSRRSWSVLATVHHFSPSLECGLVVQGDKCYRVGRNCKCKTDQCEWHEIQVHELVIDFRNKSALIGEPQDQTSLKDLPEPLKKSTFTINGDLFVIIGRHFHKIGISNCDSSKQLEEVRKWKKAITKPGSYHPCQTTTFMFDKSAWL